MKTCALKLLGIVFPLFAATAFADVTYYVSPGGDGTDPTSGNLTKAYAHPQTAIDAADGTTTFSNCRIKSTDSISVDSNGNSMRAFSMSGSAVLRRCTVQGNISGRPHSTNGQGYGTEKGGGLHVNGANVTVSGCLFRDNTATGRYNDIYVEKGTVTGTSKSRASASASGRSS